MAGGPHLVRVLSLDPELGRELSERDFQEAEDACVAPAAGVSRGALAGWPLRREPEPGFLGFLVVRGVLSHRVTMWGLNAAEVLGPGDVVRPWPAAEAERRTHDRWRVHDEAHLAVLDRQFCRRAASWPVLASALHDRETQRLDSHVTRLLIAQTPRITDRVHLLLWHLADRWGRVLPNGVFLPLRLSRALVAELVCTTRESVSRALTGLAFQGLVESTADGFLLHRSEEGIRPNRDERHALTLSA